MESPPSSIQMARFSWGNLLPTELNLQILSHLDHADLISFSEVSTACAHIAAPLLFRRIVLSPSRWKGEAPPVQDCPVEYQVLLASFQNANSRLYKLNTRVTHITLSTAPPDEENEIEKYLEDCAAELIAGTFPNLEGLKIKYATNDAEIIHRVPNFCERMFKDFFTSLSNAPGKPLKRLALEVVKPYPGRGHGIYNSIELIRSLRGIDPDKFASVGSLTAVNQTLGEPSKKSKYLSCLEEGSIIAFTRDCRNGEFNPMSIFKLSAGTLTKFTINIQPWFLLSKMFEDYDGSEGWALGRKSTRPRLRDEPTVFPLVKELNANFDFLNFLTHHDVDEFYDLGEVFPNVEDLTIFWADRREFQQRQYGYFHEVIKMKSLRRIRVPWFDRDTWLDPEAGSVEGTATLANFYSRHLKALETVKFVRRGSSVPAGAPHLEGKARPDECIAVDFCNIKAGPYNPYDEGGLNRPVPYLSKVFELDQF